MNQPAATRSQAFPDARSSRCGSTSTRDMSPPGHAHFGEEIIYVLEGTLVYEVEGRPPTTYKAGDVLIVLAGAIHSVKNIGRGNGAELEPSITVRRRLLWSAQFARLH